MRTYNFGVTGQERKNLVKALSDIMGVPSRYLGLPNYNFQVGEYIIDRDGNVTGEIALEQEILEALVHQGFVSLFATSDEDNEEVAGDADAAGENVQATEMLDADEQNMPEAEELDEYGKPEQEMPANQPDPADDTTSVCIEIPMTGFTPDALDNLCKMVSAKEPLIKKALGVDELPIIVQGDKIAFDWFAGVEDGNGNINSDKLTAYAQFITLLCETAKNKKRVTAKVQENFENERFTMRVWLIGLGMIGAEFALARKLLVSPLSGDAAWRYGKPERLARTPVSAPASGRIIFADATPSPAPYMNAAHASTPTINPAPIASDWAYIEKEKATA